MAEQIHSTTVDFVSATLADFGGITPGHVRWSVNERLADNIVRRYMLVQAGVVGGIANNAMLKPGAATTVTAILTAAAAGECAFGVNNTGASVPLSSYFWMCQGPVYTAVTDADVATLGTKLMPDVSTAGCVSAYATGADNVAVGYSKSIPGGAAAITVVGFLGGTG